MTLGSTQLTPDLPAVPQNAATPPALSDAIEAHCRRSAPGQGGVAADPCAELGEVDVWNSFTLNNTFIAQNLTALRAYANSLVYCAHAGPKGRLLMRQDCRFTISWLPRRETSRDKNCSQLRSLPKKDTLDMVSTKAAITSAALSSASSMVAHYVQFSAHSALGRSKVHRKEEKGESFLSLRSESCVFLPSPPLILSLFIMISTRVAAVKMSPYHLPPPSLSAD
ncbi:unnamed protein product [Pleuronectes platessa]|uniref:Uncharacterized protein n=1 Tax=Pleuronectes platessa TaxID=8262 RepID=A0A9N7Z5H7_PLEPL|nr:unnamed protein product [Pleuronectes platessa]